MLAIALCRKLVHAIRFWWRQRYRREALERLRVIALEDGTGVVAQAHELLKIVAIYLWGRTRVASVPERDWYVFLDAYTPNQTFGPELSSRVFCLFVPGPLHEFCGGFRILRRVSELDSDA
jgi:hypothetical protein